MKISVFGIGYVGAVSAACLARDGHIVVAVDSNDAKAALIASGKSPIVEPGLDAVLQNAAASQRLTWTQSAEEAAQASDLSLVCVGTPSHPNGSLDLTYVKRVSEQIGRALKLKREFHSVVMRSTMLPGTMDEVVIPILEEISGKTAGRDFGVGYYPEFLREGSALVDYDNPGTIIVGALDETTLSLLLQINADLPVHPCVLTLRAAEAVKYANNAWHATKISFANELGLVCKALKVDSHEVMNALCSDMKLNISAAYLKPGYAFGGSCLPKDVRALRHRARELDLDTPLLNGVLQANEQQIQQAFDKVVRARSRKVGIVGLSFKPETDDLRDSPLVELAERLLGRGFQVKIYDPIVSLSKLTGLNREHLIQRLPHITEMLVDQPGELISHSETLVLGNRREASHILRMLQQGDEKYLIDLVRVDSPELSGRQVDGLCW